MMRNVSSKPSSGKSDTCLGEISEDRRKFLKGTAVGAATALVPAAVYLGATARSARAALDTFRMYGVTTAQPPDWSIFIEATGMEVEWTDNVAHVGGFLQEVKVNRRGEITELYLMEGGMQRKLGPQGYLLPLDESRMSLWERTPDYFKRGPLYQDDEGIQYGVPTIMNADSFGYWPGELDANPDGSDELSWSLIYESDKTKGRVSLWDAWTLSMPEAANYLKVVHGKPIRDPANPTPEEAKMTADFLIERKRAGQFRVLWSEFEESIDLLGNKEVVVITCWKPAVEELIRRGQVVRWAFTKEGYYKWGVGAYVPSEVAERGSEEDVYRALDYFLGGEYGAHIARHRGHGTANFDLSLKYAADNGWPEEDIQKIRTIEAEITSKYQKPFWSNLAPDHAADIESEWERFRNA